MYERHPFEKCPDDVRILDHCHGELPTADSLLVEGHLRDCEHCRVLSAEFKSLSSAFAIIREDIEEIPIRQSPRTHGEGILGRVLEVIRTHATRPIIATSVGALLVIVIGLMILKSGDSPSEITSMKTPTASPGLLPTPQSSAGSITSPTEVPSDPITGSGSANSSEEFRLAYVEPLPEDGVRLTDILSELE